MSLRSTKFLLAALAFTASPLAITHTHASILALQHNIQAQQDASRVSSDLSNEIQSMVSNSAVIHGIQDQVATVTQTLDSYLQQHSQQSSGGSSDSPLSHAEIERLLSTVDSLSKSQREIEERQSKQIELDHANLLELIETQKKQQEMLTQELAHSKNLEVELAELKSHELEHESSSSSSRHFGASSHSSSSEMEKSQQLTSEIAQQQERFQHAFDEEGGPSEDGVFLEAGWDSSLLESAANVDQSESDAPVTHAEHDIDLQHTMNHASESDWEARAREEEDEQHFLETSGSSGSRRDVDPSNYGSSSDYLSAMNSADDAENMSPQQLQSFGEKLGASPSDPHEIGTPAMKHGLHSMSEIDSLVAEGASENTDHFEFHPNQLKTSSLKNDLSMLQDEDSIQTAMLHAQAKIKAIAAELERHQAQNGGDHSEGIEIDMEDLGADGSATM